MESKYLDKIYFFLLEIPLNTFLEKYWIDYLEPTWTYLFKHENHKVNFRYLTLL